MFDLCNKIKSIYYIIDMNVDIDESSYIPSTEHPLFFSIFKDMKLSFITLLIIIVTVYIIIFFIVGNMKGGESNSYSVVVLLLEIFLWATLIYVIYINLKNTNDENYNFQAEMKNLFNSKIADLTINSEKNHYLNGRNGESSDNNTTNKENDKKCNNDKNDNKEVFHIANNKYNYNEARDICEKYNSSLATYEQLEKAYENGANWCSYGWSKDQLALFPTQKKIYNELKNIPGHENDCGRPGINGGFFKNKEMKFGVNCFGVKPKPKHLDKHYMHSVNHTPIIDKNISNKDDVFNKFIVAPYNKDKWSGIKN